MPGIVGTCTLGETDRPCIVAASCRKTRNRSGRFRAKLIRDGATLVGSYTANGTIPPAVLKRLQELGKVKDKLKDGERSF